MSKKLRLAWFPFFAETWLYDEPVQELSPPERDAYLTLLCLQWRDGSLPFDCIRMVTKLPGKVDHHAAIRVLEAFFPPDPDTNRRRNPKLADLQHDSELLYHRKQEKMRALARKRWPVKTQPVEPEELNASRIPSRIQHLHLPLPSPTEKGKGEAEQTSERRSRPSPDGGPERPGVPERVGPIAERVLAAIPRGAPVIPETLYAPDAEAAVLGALLNNPTPAIIGAIRAACPTPASFAVGSYAALYRALLAAIDQQLPCDQLTILHFLTVHGTMELVGGVPTIAALVNEVPTAANGPFHARMVADRASRRELLREAQGIAALVSDLGRPLDTLIPEVVSKISTIGTPEALGAPMAVGGLCYATLEALTSPSGAGGTHDPLPTGLDGLDALVDGWAPDRLCVIAGRPGAGKSAFGIHAALAASEVGATVLFSLEMNTDELMLRCLANLSGVSLGRLRHNHFTDENYAQLARAAGDLQPRPLYLDTTCTTPQAMQRYLDRLVPTLTVPLRCVIVDYLSLVGWPHKTERRDLEVGAVARALKMEIARRFQVPVLCLAQLRRLGQSEASRAPRLDDLRESGEIEQHADQVVLLHYGVNEAPTKDKHGEVVAWPSPWMTKLHVAKNRHGPVGVVETHYDRSTHQWRDWSAGTPTLPAATYRVVAR